MALEDTNQDVRSQARFCFSLYMEMLPWRSSCLLIYGISSPQARKQTAQELDLNVQEIQARLQ